MTITTTNRRGPNTVVLIHGLWMTSLSWKHWMKHYTDKGFRVIARSWPGMDKEYPDRPPFTIGQAGWEAVADYALDWSLQHAQAQRAPSDDDVPIRAAGPELCA